MAKITFSAGELLEILSAPDALNPFEIGTTGNMVKGTAWFNIYYIKDGIRHKLLVRFVDEEHSCQIPPWMTCP